MRAALGLVLLAAVGCRTPTTAGGAAAIPVAVPVPVPDAVPVPVPDAVSVPVPDAVPVPDPFPVPPIYAALFRDGARYRYTVRHPENAGGGIDPITCLVSDVHRTAQSLAARVTCRDELGLDLAPSDGWPSGAYVANAAGLYRSDLVPTPEAIVMTPGGEELTLRPGGDREIAIASIQRGRSCRGERVGRQLRSLCFVPGAGIVSGTLVGARLRGRTASSYALDSVHLAGWPAPGQPPDVPASAPTVVINELAAAGDPDDWFEIVNVSAQPVALGELVFVDHAGDFARVVAFPAKTLAPGGRHVQAVSVPANGFRLGSDEALTIYRAADLARVDHVDWSERDAPARFTFARIPDARGAFEPVRRPTPGGPNR